MDPEGGLGGDTLESLIQGEDEAAERAEGNPMLPAPPENFHGIADTGRTQPRHGRAARRAEQGIALVHALDDDALGTREGAEALQQRIALGDRANSLAAALSLRE